MYIERERDRDLYLYLSPSLSLSLYIYIYIYIQNAYIAPVGALVPCPFWGLSPCVFLEPGSTPPRAIIEKHRFLIQVM